MEININEKYEIAYDFYGKMFETVDADSLNERISIAIEKTIQCMSALIDDAEGLKNYGDLEKPGHFTRAINQIRIINNKSMESFYESRSSWN